MSVDARVERDARRVRAPVGALLAVVGCLVLAAVLFYRGESFYSLGLDARVDHDDFRVLSPGETVGHGYGIAGTALIATNLLYVVRRRFPRLPLGSMRVWLDIHVFTGLFGSVLILFHSAFQLRTPIASVTSVSLLLVVVTGVVGRYLYALSPKVDLEAREANLDALDALVPGLGASARGAVEALTITDLGGHAGIFSVLRTLPTWWGESRARKRAINGLLAGSVEGLSKGERVLTKRALRRVASLASAEVRAMAAATVLRTWRGLHRLLAILMLLSVSVHIGVAWFYGYRWLWSE